MSGKSDKTTRRIARKETMGRRAEIIDGYVQANEVKIMTACMNVMKGLPLRRRIPLAWSLLRGEKKKK